MSSPLPPLTSETQNVIIAVQAFVILIVIVIVATTAIMLFLYNIKIRIKEARDDIIVEEKKTETKLLDWINRIEKTLEKSKTKIEETNESESSNKEN